MVKQVPEAQPVRKVRELREVRRDRIVERELPLIGELKDRRRDELFRDPVASGIMIFAPP